MNLFIPRRLDLSMEGRLLTSMWQHRLRSLFLGFLAAGSKGVGGCRARHRRQPLVFKKEGGQASGVCLALGVLVSARRVVTHEGDPAFLHPTMVG
jgi:hypothetical protein